MAAALGQLVGEAQELWDHYGDADIRRTKGLVVDSSSSARKYNHYLRKGEDPKSIKTAVEPNSSYPRKRQRKANSQDKIPKSGSTEQMNQEVWKEFPDDLFDEVLTKLPISSYLRFRAVCKKWDFLLRSNNYYKRYDEAASGHPWILTLTSECANSAAMYDPASRTWHHLSKQYLKSERLVVPVASAGGLVCFQELCHKHFHVCNPLSQSSKELPPSRSNHVWSRVAVGMVRDRSNAVDGYKVMWLTPVGDYEIYDSSSNSWTRVGPVPAAITLPLALNFKSQTVSMGSTIYFMRGQPDGILTYNVADGKWNQFAIPLPPDITECTLAESEGKVMLVGLLAKSAATCVCIWELQKMTLLWKEVDRMPSVWCLEFYGRTVRMTCVGNRGLVMLTLRARRLTRLVMYDLAARQWQKPPDCLLPGTRKKLHMACGVAFDLSPAALP